MASKRGLDTPGGERGLHLRRRCVGPGAAAGEEPAPRRPATQMDGEATMGGGDLERRLVQEDSLGEELPFHSLPAMLRRSRSYWTQTGLGVCLGGSLMGLYNASVAIIAAFAQPDSDLAFWGAYCLTPLTRLASITSVCCTAWVLFGQAGVVRRTPATCYPMPEEVKRRLRAGESLHDLKNIQAPEESELDSYCVRCLVWRRRAETKSHHCSVCQRCVDGFDHHCRLLGRCIVRDNMVCFYLVVGLMMLGMVDVVLAVCAVLPQGLLVSMVLYWTLCSLLVLYVCVIICLTTCTVIFGKE